MHAEAYIEMARTEDLHWWFCGRRALLKATIDSLNLPDSARILEVGSGTGGNLAMLAEFGKVSAIEMDNTARALAQKKETWGHVDLYDGSCPDRIPFSEPEFDLICLFDVLEHIERDSETLDKLRPLLNKQGRMLLTVPAHQWLWSAHDEHLHHKRRYSKSIFKEKCLAAGFKIERCTYFNTLLFPLILATRYLDTALRKKTATGTSVPPRIINNLLKTLFSCERHLIKKTNLPFGVSLLAVLSPEKGS